MPLTHAILCKRAQLLHLNPPLSAHSKLCSLSWHSSKFPTLNRMANSKLMCMITIIVLTFMFCFGISSAGRLMPPKAEKREYGEHVTTLERSTVQEKATVANNMVHWGRHSLQNEAPRELTTGQDISENPGDGEVGKWTDDFRPTTPGHSPGAGHSFPPAELGASP